MCEMRKKISYEEMLYMARFLNIGTGEYQYEPMHRNCAYEYGKGVIESDGLHKFIHPTDE